MPVGLPVGGRLLGPDRSGIGFDFSWQMQAMAEEDLSRRWSLFAGGRHLDIDFENERFVFDAATDGPIIGAVYRF